MNCRFIYFDLGLTLVRTPIEELYHQVLKAFGICKDIADIAKALYLTDKEFMRRYPHVLGAEPAHFMPWYLGVLNYNLGVQLNLEENYSAFFEIKRRTDLRWRLIPNTTEILGEIKQRDVGVGLISNWDHTCRQVLKDNGIGELFDVTVISSEVGVMKPDPGIFQIALKAAAVAPEETLYVGDNYYDDVIGAGKAGIKCLLLAPYGRAGMEEIEHQYIISSLKEVPGYIE